MVTFELKTNGVLLWKLHALVAPVGVIKPCTLPPTNIHQSLVSSWRSDDALLSCTDAMMASSCLACTLSSRRDLKRPQQSDQNFLKWQFRVRNLQRTARPPFQSIWPGSEVWCRQLRSQDEISQNYNFSKNKAGKQEHSRWDGGQLSANLIKVRSNSTLWTQHIAKAAFGFGEGVFLSDLSLSAAVAGTARSAKKVT